MKKQYKCHGCNENFTVEMKNQYGMYEFKRCPCCGSAKTTFK